MKLLSFALIALLELACLCNAADHATVVNADTALALLEKGNTTFIENPISKPHLANEARIASINSQNPIAVVVTCSDARTAPEIIFSKSINRIAVIRTAGNVVDDLCLGSIEYFVKNCGTRLVVVMGHQNCGAVKAAIAGGTIPPHINSIVNRVKPAIETAKKQRGDLLTNSIQANAIRVSDQIRHDGDLGESAKDVKVMPAVYSFETGKVHWLH
jgi:carbonic anhydrase